MVYNGNKLTGISINNVLLFTRKETYNKVIREQVPEDIPGQELACILIQQHCLLQLAQF
jgi:hypothetical protein